MAATRSRFFDSTAEPAAWPASTALRDVPRKRRRGRRSSPGLRGQSANDGFMVNLDGAMGAGVVAASLVVSVGLVHSTALLSLRLGGFLPRADHGGTVGHPHVPLPELVAG